MLSFLISGVELVMFLSISRPPILGFVIKSSDWSNQSVNQWKYAIRSLNTLALLLAGDSWSEKELSTELVFGIIMLVYRPIA